MMIKRTENPDGSFTVKVPQIPRPRTGPYSNLCWKQGAEGIAALAHCNKLKGHDGPHSWERLKKPE